LTLNSASVWRFGELSVIHAPAARISLEHLDDLSASLEGDRLPVWCIDLSDVKECELLESTLSTEEKSRADSYRYQRDRDTYVTCRGLLRVLLGFYSGENPKDVEIMASPSGKPITGDAVDFSVSHSSRYVLIGFSEDGSIGVDVEHVHPLPLLSEMVARLFPPSQTGYIMGLPEEERLRLYIKAWTINESIKKAVTPQPTEQVLDIAELQRLCPDGEAALLESTGFRVYTFQPRTGYYASVCMTHDHMQGYA